MATGDGAEPFASPELALCYDKIERCIGRIAEILVECGPDAHRAPSIAGANSLATIVNHVLENVAENLLSTVGGEPFARDRDGEFGASPEIADLLTRWEAMQPRIRAVVADTPASELLSMRPHPRRGEISVLEVFLVVLRHMGEHEGHAQLTRDWLRSTGPGDCAETGTSL